MYYYLVSNSKVAVETEFEEKFDEHSSKTMFRIL